MKKLLSFLLAALLLLSLTTAAFAQRIESPDNSAIGPSSRIMAGEMDEPRIYAINALNNSTIDGSARILVGETDELYIYPSPREANDHFDIYKAEITSSNEKVLGVAPGKRDTYEYGYVILTGKKTGVSTVTVTDPGSGASCSVKVYVLPAFLNSIMSFLVDFQTFAANLRISLFNALGIHF